jgi:hypothetical protein
MSHRRVRTVLAALITVATAGASSVAIAAASPGLAQEDAPAPPSAVWPVLGVAVAVGGGALVYRQARQARTGDPACMKVDGGCFWGGLGGTLLEEGGGAIVSYWGWRLGERAFALDRNKDVSAMKVGGLVLGGAAFLATYVGVIYGAVAPIGCVDHDRVEVDYKCVGPKQYTAQLIGLAATPVLLIAAPFAAYAFGYEGARRTASQRSSLVLGPISVPGGSGVALLGRF